MQDKCFLINFMFIFFSFNKNKNIIIYETFKTNKKKLSVTNKEERILFHILANQNQDK